MGLRVVPVGDRDLTIRSVGKCTGWINAISGAHNASGRRLALVSVTSMCVDGSTHVPLYKHSTDVTA